jgi:hypothetical protein
MSYFKETDFDFLTGIIKLQLCTAFCKICTALCVTLSCYSIVETERIVIDLIYPIS